LVERGLCKPEAWGSIPHISTMAWVPFLRRGLFFAVIDRLLHSIFDS
jgi:hypothetical protein